MEGRMRVSVVATGIDVSAEAAEPMRDVYGAAAIKAKHSGAPAAMPEATEREVAVAAPQEPSLFEELGPETPPADLFEPEMPVEDMPAPQSPPSQMRPVPAASARSMGERAVTRGDRGAAAPRAPMPGHPTPEPLTRLRDALQADHPRNPAEAARGHGPEAEAQPARNRFGINTLINRMTGHGEDTQAPVVRRTPNFAAQPPQTHVPAREPENAVDPEQDRIEIPAFLRRQAN
jgi:cell division protein FtsZ